MTPEVTVVYSLTIARGFADLVRECLPDDRSIFRMDVLRAIEAGEDSIVKISKRARRNRVTVSRIVKDLRKAGYAVSEQTRGGLSLTPRGKKLILDFQKWLMIEFEARLESADVTQEQLDIALRVLSAVSRAKAA